MSLVEYKKVLTKSMYLERDSLDQRFPTHGPKTTDEPQEHGRWSMSWLVPAAGRQAECHALVTILFLGTLISLKSGQSGSMTTLL